MPPTIRFPARRVARIFRFACAAEAANEQRNGFAPRVIKKPGHSQEHRAHHSIMAETLHHLIEIVKHNEQGFVSSLE